MNSAQVLDEKMHSSHKAHPAVLLQNHCLSVHKILGSLVDRSFLLGKRR